MVSDWRQHGDESFALICQGKDAEFVKDSPSVGGGWKRPANIVLVDEKATTPSGLRPLGPSLWNVWETSKSSVVAASLSLRPVQSTRAQRTFHSLGSWR